MSGAGESGAVAAASGAQRGDPWRDHRFWSIDLCAGPSPFALSPPAARPALTAADVTDVDAAFVADPFLLRGGAGRWQLYFEILLRESRKGVIGLATGEPDLSRPGAGWRYQGVVLEESFHLSYPHVFAWQGALWMVPEAIGAGAVRLYRARRPAGPFEPVADLVPGVWADPTLLHHGGRWWLFACPTPYQNHTLELFFAEALTGPWQRHPQSPIVTGDRRSARPGGRVVVADGRPVRLAQDCVRRYGHQLRAFELLELTPTRYREREHHDSPLLRPAEAGWNSAGMHHLDAQPAGGGRWLAAVDGDEYRIPPGATPAPC